MKIEIDFKNKKISVEDNQSMPHIVKDMSIELTEKFFPEEVRWK